MSLEVGNYISALDSVNPTGSDPKSRGDDHLRLIKSTLKNSFAGITGAVLVGGTNGGVANAYTLTPTPTLVSYITNMTIVFSPVVSNTGASTIDVSGLGAINLRSVSGAALISGELASGQTYKAIFNGTEFRLDSITKNYADQLSFSTALPAQSLGFLISNGSAASFSKKHVGYAQDEVRGTDIPSASSINLQTATGNLLHVTGTTTITSITLDSGALREVVFDGILTLTNGASLILPTGANIVTAAGDSATFRGEPSGVVRLVKYQRADGRALAVTPPGSTLIAGPLTPSAAANVDFLNTFSSTYDDYEIQIDGINSAAAENLRIRLAVAGVADAGNNYQFYQIDDPASGSNGVSFIEVIAGGVANQPRSATIRVSNVNSAVAFAKCVLSFGISSNNAGIPQGGGRYGAHTAANVATGFRLLWSGGSNFLAQGSIKVYGISKV
jgi:hypothetical protein